MNLLKLQSDTQLIGGKQAESYGIYCGGVLVRSFSPFEYDRARSIVNKANEIITAQIRALISGE